LNQGTRDGQHRNAAKKEGDITWANRHFSDAKLKRFLVFKPKIVQNSFRTQEGGIPLRFNFGSDFVNFGPLGPTSENGKY